MNKAESAPHATINPADPMNIVLFAGKRLRTQNYFFHLFKEERFTLFTKDQRIRHLFLQWLF
ncbi:MAG: hypothetical protein COA36_02710 [Desulfotalea sp.]|nr:MAG: hypothetical protein COA36_02710 [Desulfotalea sp.]